MRSIRRPLGMRTLSVLTGHDHSYPLEDIPKTWKVEFVIAHRTMDSFAELFKTWDLSLKSEAPVGRTSHLEIGFVRGMGMNDGH